MQKWGQYQVIKGLAMQKWIVATAISWLALTGCGGGDAKNATLTIYNPDGSIATVNPAPTTAAHS